MTARVRWRKERGEEKLVPLPSRVSTAAGSMLAVYVSSVEHTHPRQHSKNVHLIQMANIFRCTTRLPKDTRLKQAKAIHSRWCWALPSVCLLACRGLAELSRPQCSHQICSAARQCVCLLDENFHESVAQWQDSASQSQTAGMGVGRCGCGCGGVNSKSTRRPSTGATARHDREGRCATTETFPSVQRNTLFLSAFHGEDHTGLGQQYGRQRCRNVSHGQQVFRRGRRLQQVLFQFWLATRQL